MSTYFVDFNIDISKNLRFKKSDIIEIIPNTINIIDSSKHLGYLDKEIRIRIEITLSERIIIVNSLKKILNHDGFWVFPHIFLGKPPNRPW